jgi:hypothetical protein
MKRCQVLVLVVFLMIPGIAQTQDSTEAACPVTLGSSSLGPPFPESETWYGSESIAVMLPADGKWSITAPGARIAVKLPIWSLSYKLGMEENLTIRVEALFDGPNDVVVRDITNACADYLLADCTMLAGIDFPSAGCWRLTLDYFGQSLSFVVATIEPVTDETAT